MVNGCARKENCANFSGIRAETDARADIKYEISFNRPKRTSKISVYGPFSHFPPNSKRLSFSSNLLIFKVDVIILSHSM